MASTAEAPPAEEPLLPRPWSVGRVVHESGDVVSLEIRPGPGGAAGACPRPGQFNMLYVPGVGEVPISVSGLPGPGRVLHTVRDVGSVTRALCRLAPGDVVGVRGPFGSSWPFHAPSRRDVVIAAGGIGLAPLRPVIEAIVGERDRYDDVVLLYGARGPRELLYQSEHARWRGAGVQVEITVDHADRGWTGHVGVVTTLIRHARFDAPEATALLCGPEIMMHFTARELVRRGVDPQRVFVSMERNMQCGVGLCGHCQLGPELICRDGPVLPWPRVERLMAVREL